MQNILTEEMSTLLNTIGKNIFVTDSDFTILHINEYADELIHQLAPYTGYHSRSDFINVNIDVFHPGYADRVRNTLTSYESYPYETTINLYNKFTAHIVINPYEMNGSRQGYVLTWSDVTEYEAELRNSNLMLEEMYTPILETVLSGVLLVPIVGILTEPRLIQMKKTLLKECVKRRANEIIFDYTGVASFDEPYLIQHMSKIETSLGILGVRCTNSGFQAEVASEIAEHVSLSNLNSRFFPTLRDAMLACHKDRDFEIKKI